jgi:peptidoglycan L-alanyl-D-glutamate endopeptidase CwlK
MMDAISEQRLAEVHPKLANLIRMVAHQMQLENTVIRVTQGLRTWEEQDALYAKGRTAPGPVVTNCPGGYSWHNFGMAVDLAPFDAESQPDWNIEHPAWGRMVSIATGLGMVSGSQWKTFKDWPHFQLTGVFPVNPDDHVRDLFKSGGIPAIWNQAFQPDQTA